MLVTAPDLPDEAAAMVARTPRGDCVFYHQGSGFAFIAIWVRQLRQHLPVFPAACGP